MERTRARIGASSRAISMYRGGAAKPIRKPFAGSQRRCQRPATRQLRASTMIRGSRNRLSRATAADAGFWRCNFTPCARVAIGATAISAISRHLLELIAELGGAGIGLNPLHALFYDRPGAGSPYSPNSRLFFNPLYIDVEAVEEFQHGDAARVADEIDRLRAAELVDYHCGCAAQACGACASPIALSMRVAAKRVAGISKPTGASAAGRSQCFAAFETLRGQYSGPWWDLAGSMAPAQR